MPPIRTMEQTLVGTPAYDLTRSPYYGELRSEGEAGTALIPYLYRLALTTDNYTERSRQFADNDEGDEIDKGLISRLGDEHGLGSNGNAQQLTDILTYSLRELTVRPELRIEGVVDWLGLGTALLKGALSHLDSGEENVYLTSAVSAALMSEMPEDRLTFLERVADYGLGPRMAKALGDSEVSFVHRGYRNADVRTPAGGSKGRSIHRLRNFAAVFGIAREDVVRYRQLVERNFGNQAEAQAATGQSTADSSAAAGTLPHNPAEALENESVSAPYVDRYRIDPTKKERFDLEEVFIQDQMAALFPGGDTSSFRQNLARKAVGFTNIDTALDALRSDIQAVISDMSLLVTERYNVPAGEPTGAWQPEQLVAWRYRQLVAKGAIYDTLAKFADPSIYGSTSNFRSNIYVLSKDGAALPDMISEAVRHIIRLGRDYCAAPGNQVKPEELKAVAAQAIRPQLMKPAAKNMDHLSASLVQARALREGARTPAISPKAQLRRRADGRLDLDGPLFELVEASSQSATRLACVALRVNVENAPEAVARQTSSAAHNKINSIELLSMLVIDEAYRRGIFTAGLAAAQN